MSERAVKATIEEKQQPKENDEEEEFNLPIIILPNKYSSSNTQLNRLEEQTEQLTHLLSHNIEKAREKGKDLEVLSEKTYDLYIRAELFRSTAVFDEPNVAVDVQESEHQQELDSNRKIVDIKDQLGNLIDITNDNLHKATNRGLDLEQMLYDSKRLAEGAKAFNATNRRVKRKLFFKNKKLLAILIIVIFLIFIVFILFLNSVLLN